MLDQKHKGVFDSSTPQHLKMQKKFDVQNPIIGNYNKPSKCHSDRGKRSQGAICQD